MSNTILSSNVANTVYSINANGPWEFSSSDHTKINNDTLTGTASGTTIQIGDNIRQWQTGDTLIWENGKLTTYPLIQQPVYSHQIILPQPYTVDEHPNTVDEHPSYVPYQQPITLPWQQPIQAEPVKLKPEEVLAFLEGLGIIPEKTIEKIREALKPPKPIDYNNRIDDIIIKDIEE